MFYGVAKRARATTSCPFCGKPLRTARAQQGRHCGRGRRDESPADRRVRRHRGCHRLLAARGREVSLASCRAEAPPYTAGSSQATAACLVQLHSEQVPANDHLRKRQRMHSVTNLRDRIGAFYGKLASDRHHRYRSWEHCYRFFRAKPAEDLVADKDTAALHLGFYLASWGMYRGSAFLLQRAYTVHTGAVEALASPQFSPLWHIEAGSGSADRQLVPTILALVEAVKESYKPFGLASDVLATKVILGTTGSLPAVDRFFIAGFRKSQRPYSKLTGAFVERIIEFCNEYAEELRVEQARIEAAGNVCYPLMKLADMYFWQVGYDAAPPKVRRQADRVL